jgi:uncharacterized protein YeaO (DUF488 family)
VHEKAAKENGKRVLVERLWPKRISKKAARIDEWLREGAISDKLRKSSAYDPKKWRISSKKTRKSLRLRRI